MLNCHLDKKSTDDKITDCLVLAIKSHNVKLYSKNTLDFTSNKSMTLQDCYLGQISMATWGRFPWLLGGDFHGYLGEISKTA